MSIFSQAQKHFIIVSDIEYRYNTYINSHHNLLSLSNLAVIVVVQILLQDVPTSQ